MISHDSHWHEWARCGLPSGDTWGEDEGKFRSSKEALSIDSAERHSLLSTAGNEGNRHYWFALVKLGRLKALLPGMGLLSIFGSPGRFDCLLVGRSLPLRCWSIMISALCSVPELEDVDRSSSRRPWTNATSSAKPVPTIGAHSPMN